MDKKVLVAVAGGFDPLRYGHISHMKEARKLGTRLVVIVNSDEDMIRKKSYCLMTQLERMQIINEFPFVSEVVACLDKDGTATETLRWLRPDIFAKGGDRVLGNMPQSEIDVCAEIDCIIVYDVGDPKDGSSRELVEGVLEQLRRQLGRTKD